MALKDWEKIKESKVDIFKIGEDLFTKGDIVWRHKNIKNRYVCIKSYYIHTVNPEWWWYVIDKGDIEKYLVPGNKLYKTKAQAIEHAKQYMRTHDSIFKHKSLGDELLGI